MHFSIYQNNCYLENKHYLISKGDGNFVIIDYKNFPDKFMNTILKNNTESWKKKTALFLISQMFSIFGSSVVSYAVIWYITLETSSARVMTLSIITSFLPQIFISLFAGVWADRYNRKLIIMGSDLLSAGASLFLALSFISGDYSLKLIFLVNALRSIGSGIQTPAVSAILPQLVPEDKLVQINGINSSLSSVLMLVSPAVGGFLLATMGFSATLYVDVFTAVVAVIIIGFLKYEKIKRPQESIEGAAVSSTLSYMKEGFIYAKNNPLIKSLLVFYTLFFFLVTPAAFLTPIMVERSFGPEVWKLTANEVTWTLGSLIGGIIISVWGGFKNRLATMSLSCAGFGLTFTILGFATNIWVYLGIMFIAGIFMPMFATVETVLIQENVEEHMLGRVFSFIQIIISAVMPLGMLLFGPLGDAIRIEYIIIATGICLFILAPFILRIKENEKST